VEHYNTARYLSTKNQQTLIIIGNAAIFLATTFLRSFCQIYSFIGNRPSGVHFFNFSTIFCRSRSPALSPNPTWSKGLSVVYISAGHRQHSQSWFRMAKFFISPRLFTCFQMGAPLLLQEGSDCYWSLPFCRQ
jgi:hypothetical protein